MNCHQFEEIVRELSHGAPLHDATADNALAHARMCAACDARLAEEQELTASLRNLAAADSHVEAPIFVERNLRAAFRELHAPPRKMQRRFRPMMWIETAALAAAAAAAFFVTTHSYRSSSPAKLAVAAPGATLATPVENPGAKQATEQNAAAAVAQNADSNSNLNASNARIRPAVETNTDAEFVELPYSGGLQPDENASVVRVSLSGPALSSLGYPMVADSTSGSVIADVIVGEDGTARAIRVVQ